jgi:hypothetical protein
MDIISNDSSPEATAELVRLSDTPSLASYHARLLHALAVQRNRRRDKEFTPPTLLHLKGAFQGTGFVSPDDVVAIFVDQLLFIEQQYRGGDTTGWRKYWNTGARGVIENPKIEDHCRDILLDDLRPRLMRYRLAVNQATPANAGNEADASIQAMDLAGIRIPVEMKMQHNREVWSAPHDQLLAKYVIDPRSGGRGIYLVFWTGAGGVPAHPKGLSAPSTAKEMRESLVDLLGLEERAQIAVVVIDVSSR